MSVVGDWDPLGMRGTVSRTLLFRDVFVAEEQALMPRGALFPGGDALAAHVPDPVADLYGPRAGRLRLHRQVPARRSAGHAAGEAAHVPDEADRRRRDAHQARAAKALWFQAVTEAQANPTKEQVLRAYAAQFSTMESANDIARLAIRTCGGQSMLKSLPLERIYRDSRCGSLMLPWTAELCLDRIGREALYEPGETDA